MRYTLSQHRSKQAPYRCQRVVRPFDVPSTSGKHPSFLHFLHKYNLKVRVGLTQRVREQKAVNLLFIQNKPGETRKETLSLSNNSFPGVLTEKCNCHPPLDFNVPVLEQNTNSAKSSSQLSGSCAFSCWCFVSFKKNTVNDVVSDAKWNLESNLRYQHIIIIHNNEYLALLRSPSMFLAMENNEVYLAVLFCSDVSFTVLKNKNILVALQLISKLVLVSDLKLRSLWR